MKTVFHIVDGVISNIVVQDNNFVCDGIDWVENDNLHGIGDSYDVNTGVFTYKEQVPTIPEVISDRQFFQQLAVDGSITEEEAIEAVKNGTLPTIFDNFILSLPLAERFNAAMLFSGATVFKRSHPLVETFRLFLNYEPEDIDRIWLEASKI